MFKKYCYRLNFISALIVRLSKYVSPIYINFIYNCMHTGYIHFYLEEERFSLLIMEDATKYKMVIQLTPLITDLEHCKL